MKKLMLIDEETGETRQITNEEAIDLVAYILESIPDKELQKIERFGELALKFQKDKNYLKELVKGGE